VFRDVVAFGGVLRRAHHVDQVPLHWLRLLRLRRSTDREPRNYQHCRRDSQHPHTAPPRKTAGFARSKLQTLEEAPIIPAGDYAWPRVEYF
jgi:hypothetical protein